MIGLIIVAIFAGYIILSIIVISVVYKKTKNIKKMFIALAIMILIPTWDVIIGYPIYKFLCATQAGVHIYKTVDNVEGFYVGKQDKRFKPHMPYDGYRYIDYKEMNYSKPTGKYYRSYWIDSNTSEECIRPRYPDSPYDEYSKAFRSGKCIAEKEITEGEVSRWEYIDKPRDKTMLFVVNMKIESTISIKDRKNRNVLSEAVSIVWNGGWLYGFLSSIPVGNNWKVRYPRIIDINFNEFIHKTLKTKKEER